MTSGLGSSVSLRGCLGDSQFSVARKSTKWLMLMCSEEIDLSRSFGYERMKNAQLELWGCVTPCAIFGRVWQEMNILRLRVMLSHVMISKSCLRLIIVVRFLPICHFRSSIVFFLICVGLCSLVRAVHCVGYCLGRRCDM